MRAGKPISSHRVRLVEETPRQLARRHRNRPLPRATAMHLGHQAAHRTPTQRAVIRAQRADAYARLLALLAAFAGLVTGWVAWQGWRRGQ